MSPRPCSSRTRFLSTPSARRATQAAGSFQPRHKISIHALREEGDGTVKGEEDGLYISIHALREEGDLSSVPTQFCSVHFYPRPPRGGRRYPLFCAHKAPCISIHALREEGDHTLPHGLTCNKNFYPRPPRGGRPPGTACGPDRRGISIHALREEGDHYQSGHIP